MAIKGVRATAAALAVTAGTVSSLGQTWQGGYSQYWNDYQNWQPQQLPGRTSDVIIPETAGQVECGSMLLLEIGSIDCRSGLYLFNTILKPSGTAYVKNLVAGATRAGGLFTLDGVGQLGTHQGPGPHANLGTYSYGTAWIQGTEFRNSGTIEGYLLGVMPDGQTPGVLKNTGTIKLGVAGFGGQLNANGQGSHILNQGTIVKLHPEPVSMGGGFSPEFGFIQESGSTSVQQGLLGCAGTRWVGGAVAVGENGVLRLSGPDEWDGLPAITGQGVLDVGPILGQQLDIRKDITLDLEGPGKARLGGVLCRIADATLTNAGQCDWYYLGFQHMPGFNTGKVRNTRVLTIPSYSPGVGSAVDIENSSKIDMYASLQLQDQATLTNEINGLLFIRRGSIEGAQSTRIANTGEINRPVDSAPELSVINVPLDMDGGAVHLVPDGPQEADLMLTGGGVWANGAEAIAGTQRELLIPGGVYTFHGAGNRFRGGGNVIAYYWSQTGTPTFQVAADGELELAMSPWQFELRGGKLGGPGTVRNTGNLMLSGGAIGVDGAARVENYGFLSLHEPTAVDGTLINLGQAVQGNQGSISLNGEIRNVGDGFFTGSWTANTQNGSISGTLDAVFHNQGNFKLNAARALDVSVRFNNTGSVVSGGELAFVGPVDQLSNGVLTGGAWKAVPAEGRIHFPSAITKIGAGATVHGTAEQIPQLAGLTEVAGELNVMSITSFPNLSSVTGSGRINFPDGTTLQAQTGLNVGSPSIVSGGRIVTESTPEAFLITPLLANGGRVIPGDEDGAAIIDLTGDYQQNATGRLEIELGGLTPGMQHDVFEVSGQASLSGTLQVALIDDFVPSIGDEFTILTAGSIVGTFDTLDLPALPTGRAWEVLYASGGEPWVIVRVIDSCYPDCNQSGTLTVSDFGCFQTKFVIGDPYADCNGDGNSTVADFGCFQTRFVVGCP